MPHNPEEATSRSVTHHCSGESAMERMQQRRGLRALWTGVGRLLTALCCTVAAALADVLWKVDLRELVARLLSTCFVWLPSFTDALLCIPLVRSLWCALPLRSRGTPKPDAGRGPRGGVAPSCTRGTDRRTHDRNRRVRNPISVAPLTHQATALRRWLSRTRHSGRCSTLARVSLAVSPTLTQPVLTLTRPTTPGSPPNPNPYSAASHAQGADGGGFAGAAACSGSCGAARWCWR